MDIEQLRRAFDEGYDQALVFHGFADFARDNDVYVATTSDPITGIPPQHLRYRFTNCVQAVTTTTVPSEIWQRSLDDRLTLPEAADIAGLNGFVWGVRWQPLYPGFQLVENSHAAADWTRRLGIMFREVLIETNTHAIRLIAAALVVTELDPGHAAFVVHND